MNTHWKITQESIRSNSDIYLPGVFTKMLVTIFENEKSNFKRMKHLSLILILLIFFSCKKDNTFIVKGKVLHKESGIVRLNQIGEKAFNAKTCKLANGEFYFEGEVDLPEEFFIQYKENESSRGTNYFKFFVEPETETEIIFNTEDFYKSEFKGSKIGDDYWEVSKTIYNEFGSQIEKLIPEFQNAQKTNDKDLLENIINKSDSVSIEIQNYELKYIWNHPNSYISAKLLYDQQYKLNPDTLDLYFNRLDKKLFESKYYKRIQAFLLVQVGKPYVDFELPDSSGTMHQFSSIAKNKVTLIDFWFRGCKACRVHNKELKELYETYKSEGFEIVGVSGDENISDFIKTIEEDKMTWINLHDKNYKESVGSIYELNIYPFNVLIDKNGLIAYKANDYKNLKTVVDSLIRN